MIKILDTHTINKIAAGEVVERPSSVVKELVENSIDAKASSITIEIKNGGVDMIRVTDNGIGIPKDEVEIAFLRHATSKITTAEDLYEVTSLGFRGEALASIAAVSHVELLSKQESDVTGKRVTVSGGKIATSEEVAVPNGTTFIMRHLFFNVPARKAFLGSSGSEGAKISDYISKLALAHPEISFKYIQNGKTLFSTSGDHQLQHTVLNVYGKEYAKNTVKCFYHSEAIECAGLLGLPSITRSNRNYEHFFINGRYIKSTLLQNAVEDAYKSMVMVGKFPFVILHITLDPSSVDVNVHPTKMQIRFKNTDLIYRSVYEAVHFGLQEANLVPNVNLDKPKGDARLEPQVAEGVVDTFFAPRKEENTSTMASLLEGERANKVSLEVPKVNPYKPEPQTIERLFGKESSPHEAISHQRASRPQETKTYTSLLQNTFSAPSQKAIKEEESSKSYTSEVKQTTYLDASIKEEATEIVVNASGLSASDYRIVGQLFKTYWLIQYHEKVFIVDQHAAHERVLYEQFMAHFREGEVATQLLLMPETLNLTPVEMNLLQEQEVLFNKIGFQFEVFGDTSIVIREVPFILNEPIPASVFREVLDTLTENRQSSIADVKAESIIRLSCRSAIKAHDTISERECEELIGLLLGLDNPFTCPHGRPTLVALTKTDIEKMFKRI